MKKFKTRKKHRFIKIIVFVLIIMLSYFLTSNYIKKINTIEPKEYIKFLLNNGLNNQIKVMENKNNNINAVSLFKHNLSIKYDPIEYEKQTVEYIEQTNNNMDNPLVYIYNTHDTEEYKLDYKYEYSLIPNVKIASYILQEKLSNEMIKSIVETSSVKDILNQNNWTYRYSYKASRVLLEQKYNENKTLKYFIDIHRDSSNYEKTILEYNNKKYARILFVVGLEHDNYKYNLELANKINNMLDKKIPGITRGISKKEGIGVNGIYNQDFNKNCILIEIGGLENNIYEVSNTINVLGDILSELIKEDK